MIYNLAQYLRDNFPAEIFFINVSSANNNQLPDRMINISEPPGREQPMSGYTVKAITFTMRDIDPVKSYKLSWLIYDFLINCYNIDLPAVTVGGDIYPVINIGAVNPGQTPYLMGPDPESRIKFVFNLIYNFRRF